MQHKAVVDSTSSTPAHRIFFGDPSSASWIENNHYYVRMQSGQVHKLCNIYETRLKGPGNHQNILAVLATLSRYPIDPAAVSRAISDFLPLPHRLEEVATIDGVTYVNDSISTVPEAAINALDTFSDAVQTLILGGYDRGISFDGLARHLRGTAVRTIILFPPSGARIEVALRNTGDQQTRPVSFFSVDSMQAAIRLAHKHTPPGSVCLLSPASPSFPLFRNFKERGDIFKREVLSLRNS
jgi:UDP-N-acetylmuramoylalanine--D-glutamate ligase